MKLHVHTGMFWTILVNMSSQHSGKFQSLVSMSSQHSGEFQSLVSSLDYSRELQGLRAVAHSCVSRDFQS